MAEKIFFQSCANSTTNSVKIGLSGIVKRIRIAVTANYTQIADGSSGGFTIVVTPTLDGYTMDSKMKFIWYRSLAIDATEAGRTLADNTISFDVNFYVDKEDYLVFRNTLGATYTALLHIDIVPVSDKTRLYLGGEYHNQ